ncbi:MAG: phage tail protein [Silvanigrellaceae bacterium]|nr:phage tail protein [Silvanigrellaceae bacterium]
MKTTRIISLLVLLSSSLHVFGQKPKSTADLEKAIEALRTEILQIKTKANQTKKTFDGIVGQVVAYTSEKVPDGWLHCDGRAVAIKDYPELYKVIGNTYGTPINSNDFKIPDYRGMFLRGMDAESNNDPDCKSRLPMAEGANSGCKVGSTQEDSIKSHSHTGKTEAVDLQHTHGYYERRANIIWSIPKNWPNDSTRTEYKDGGSGFFESANFVSNYSTGYSNNDLNHAHTFKTTDTGGIETRPKNASVVWIIKSNTN